jgi:hypothetical protein
LIFYRKRLEEFNSEDENHDDFMFYFIVYLPFHQRLFELDGIKSVRIIKQLSKTLLSFFFKSPIDHGAISNENEWVNVAQPIVHQRMQKWSIY